MTALTGLLIARITQSGPITVADYMAECLLHPRHGYYATRDPLGGAGDFTTAPEISQMFGEMIGLALAQAWLDRGAPAPFTLAELGPGRGTLMADILRATAHVPGFHAAAQVHLVEASPKLRTIQAEQLAAHTPTHHDSADTLPDQPLFLVANEFFDALPVRQFVRDEDGWRERQVGVQNGKLILGLSGPTPAPFLTHRREDTAHGDVVEYCPAASAVLAPVAARIQTHGGAALVIDYGEWRSQGDTLQALKAHRPVDPLRSPGEADLTCHVDFEALISATDLIPARVAPQGLFLERLGITQRARALAKALSGPALDSHVAAHRRLTHPDEMGTLFKVLGLTRAGEPAIPGTTHDA
ncbi:SAM-dependent methyltransferase [Aliiroseovarius sp.]|uniref:class I SAM-dependent methyltransferase n=1 Tax=Aliiroseovarius sp. TaxID=1872442 RepID=UPI002620F522|nr:SAM-dependent methyltransferase [Aliiroseovarius sp.]